MMNDLKNIQVDSSTQIYGVFGDPIRQSKSPIIQNRAFQVMGINAVYGAFHVKPEGLKDAMNGIRALGFGGINVTAPHKVRVMEYLDDIDEAVRYIGAVNTVVHKDGMLIGHNTDGIGYVRSLKEDLKYDLQGKTIVVVGAGGAARGVVYAMAKEQPKHIIVMNRTEEKAKALADKLSPLCSIEGIGLAGIEHIKQQNVDVVVNTTSVGMAPRSDEMAIDPSWFHEGLIVSDLIYNPRMTKLLEVAEKRGAKIHGGLGMFVYQGAYAFEYWTGKSAPVNDMRSVVEAVL